MNNLRAKTAQQYKARALLLASFLFLDYFPVGFVAVILLLLLL